MIENYTVLDLESTGLNACYGARITCICAKTSSGEWFKQGMVDERALIVNFLTWINLHKESTLITANGFDFDVPFICMRASILGLPAGIFSALLSMSHFDLQQETYRKISLNDLALLLLGERKTGTGQGAILLFAEKRFDELLKYCVHDVELTERVYLAYMKNKAVRP